MTTQLATAPRKKKKKLLLLAHGRHGKDTAAEILNQQLGYRLVSSSAFAAEKVMMPYFKSIGIDYISVDACFEDRHTGSNRAVWYDQIKAYNSPDKSRLAREILEVADIYVGMRSDEEFDASKHLFDEILWIDATARGVPLEGRDSFTIDYDPAIMRWVDNNGTVEELEQRVIELARGW